MGLNDRYTFPQTNKSGFVQGRDFNEGMKSLRDFLRFYTNMGAYVVHPDQIAGALPSFEAVFQQAKEVPSGWPVIINLVPNTEYTEDFIVPQTLAEDHDIYVMNPFEDYTEVESTIRFSGDVILPEIHAWPTRRKMFNLFGISTQGCELKSNSGWDCNIRRCQHENMKVTREHQGEGTKIWFHDCVLEGNFRMEDLDNAQPDSHFYLSHCSVVASDNPTAAFQMRGNYNFHVIESYLSLFFSTGNGIFDLTHGAPFTGKVKWTGNNIIGWMSGSPVFARSGLSCQFEWEGANVIQKMSGSASSFRIGEIGSHLGWPECRLQGIFPGDPPNGCRASDDKNDYKNKVWDGAAWV